jgi:nuclear GTP-binding protein
VVNDFLRGKLPWFTPPPHGTDTGAKAVEGREGRLGEMPHKRKRDDPTLQATEAEKSAETHDDDALSSDSNPFEGFDKEDSNDDDDDDDVDESDGGIIVGGDVEPDESASGGE